MPVNCGICSQPCASDNSAIKCSGTCERIFHLKCIKDDVEGRKTRSNSKDWKCKDCRIASSSHSSTSDVSTSITKDFLLRVMEDFKAEVFNEIKPFRKEISDLATSTQFLSDKMDASNTLMKQINDHIAVLKKENEELRTLNINLTSTVGDLQEKVRALEQYTRRTNIEISGIPETPKENVMDIVRDVGAAIGVEVQDSQISAAHRIPSFKKDRIPSLVVQFTNKALRDSWVGRFKEKKSLSAREVNNAFSNTSIYINEHLSPDNKQFLSKLKSKCKEIGYAYVWCKDGKFFVRKVAGEKCQRITNHEQICKLK